MLVVMLVDTLNHFLEIVLGFGLFRDAKNGDLALRVVACVLRQQIRLSLIPFSGVTKDLLRLGSRPLRAVLKVLGLLSICLDLSILFRQFTVLS